MTTTTTDAMHTCYARINNISAFLSSCLMALLGAIAVSSFLFAVEPKGALNVKSINMYVSAGRPFQVHANHSAPVSDLRDFQIPWKCTTIRQ